MDLIQSSALRLIHLVFYEHLYRELRDNGFKERPPLLEVDSKQEFEVKARVGHREFRG